MSEENPFASWSKKRTEEMGAKIENAFYSIGREASPHAFPGLEFKAITVKFRDVPISSADDVVIDWVPADLVTQMLSDKWRMERHIVCPPYVMFIFHRVKETEENEREQ